MITCMPRWGFDAREMSPFSSSRGVELRGVKPDRKPARSQRRSLSIFLEELSDDVGAGGGSSLDSFDQPLATAVKSNQRKLCTLDESADDIAATAETAALREKFSEATKFWEGLAGKSKKEEKKKAASAKRKPPASPSVSPPSSVRLQPTAGKKAAKKKKVVRHGATPKSASSGESSSSSSSTTTTTTTTRTAAAAATAAGGREELWSKFEAARVAVGLVKASQLSERILRDANPPPLVQKAVVAVVRVVGLLLPHHHNHHHPAKKQQQQQQQQQQAHHYHAPAWSEVQAVLRQPRFLKRLVEFDPTANASDGNNSDSSQRLRSLQRDVLSDPALTVKKLKGQNAIAADFLRWAKCAVALALHDDDDDENGN